NVIAVKLPLADSSQVDIARARALCLDRLVRHLTSGSGDEAVRGIVADNNKDTALNKLDHQVLEKLRGTGVISRQVGFAHGPIWNVIAVKLPLADSSQVDIARARALCLDRLVRHLTSGSGDEAVRGIVADNNKDTALNKLDHQVLEKLRGTGVISRQVGFAHG